MESFKSIVASNKLHGLASSSEPEQLTVRVFSFSFHRGLPQDESGNGGGFVFDGRSLPNPGREERFKTLTGKDAPVIDYLNQQESVHQFLASVTSLVDASVSAVIINVHHFADMIVEYLKTNDNFGIRIEISREEDLLDTGGGLKKAAHFFVGDSGRSDSSSEEPIIVHNVDVLSTIDLRRMVQFHNENHALATLAVQDRKTSRYLLFDDRLQLCGRRSGDDNDIEPELVR